MNEFHRVGFIIVRDFIDVIKWHALAKSLEPKGIEDNQVSNALSFYKLPELQPLHDACLPKLEDVTGLKLYTTYQYFRLYHKGATLAPHKDRPSCEISLSLNLGGDDWEIGIFDYDNVPYTNLLKPGDALVYHGCDLIHFRPGKLKGDELIQIFLHYVDQFGKRAMWKGDPIVE